MKIEFEIPVSPKVEQHIRKTFVIGNKVVHVVMQRRVMACAGGVCVMLAGTSLIPLEPHFVPHFMWDALCYSIHGMGCIPLFKPLDGLVGKIIDTAESKGGSMIAEMAETAVEEA